VAGLNCDIRRDESDGTEGAADDAVGTEGTAVGAEGTAVGAVFRVSWSGSRKDGKLIFYRLF
jgi:hypothetical protein